MRKFFTFPHPLHLFEALNLVVFSGGGSSCRCQGGVYVVDFISPYGLAEFILPRAFCVADGWAELHGQRIIVFCHATFFFFTNSAVAGTRRGGGGGFPACFFSFPEKPDELVTDSGITSLILSIVSLKFLNS